MRVAMLCGSWALSRCGVADYAERLATALKMEDVDVIRLGASNFGIRSIGSIRRDLSESNADILHIQYPAVGYDRSLLPAFLAAVPRRRPVVVTLHEFESFRFYRIPWFIPYATRANALIFTNINEYRVFERRMRRMPSPTQIIPIGSNIPVGVPGSRVPRSVCYFGLIMPGKGLEQFLALTERLLPECFVVSMIGSVPADASDYGSAIVERFRKLGGQTFLDKAPDQVADLLQMQTYAYLPFPDGATDKRGSLLAALANGVRVLAPLSEKSAPPIRDLVVPAQDHAEAAARLLVLAGHPTGEPGRPAEGVTDCYSWDAIAARHMTIYNSLLA